MDKIKKEYKNIFHISHNDLDGYGCQFMLKESNIKANTIHFINSGYGLELTEKIIAVKNLLQSGDLLLFSDVNLTLEQSELVNELITDEIQVLLIDHHETGKDSAEQFSWYLLNKDFCATRLVYLHLLENGLISGENKDKLDYISDLVNTYDLFKTNHELFGEATFLSDSVFAESHLIKGSSFDREYKFHIIQEISSLYLKGLNIEEVEMTFYQIEKAFVNGKINEGFFSNTKMPLKQKKYRILYENLDKVPSFDVNLDGKVKVFLNLGAGPFQYISNWILTEENNQYDYILHVSDSGNISLRSVGDFSVSSIAKKFFGGGGHHNASGGRVLPARERVKDEAHLKVVLAEKGALL